MAHSEYLFSTLAFGLICWFFFPVGECWIIGFVWCSFLEVITEFLPDFRTPARIRNNLIILREREREREREHGPENMDAILIIIIQPTKIILYFNILMAILTLFGPYFNYTKQANQK